jgi:hypothetical protein
MSFDHLPIELVHDITGCLPSTDYNTDSRVSKISTDLNTVSRVSKKFRAAAEPHLYRNLVFHVNGESRVRWLLATLLHRPKLAAYIKSIQVLGPIPSNVVTPATASPRPSCDMNGYFEHAGTALDTAILDICGPHPDLARGRSSWREAVSDDDYFEGSLALIVFMAINIKLFTFRPLHFRPEGDCLVPEAGKMMGTFMSVVLTDLARISYAPGFPQIRRLRNLEFLHITSPLCWYLCMLPSLKTIQVNSPVYIHSVGTNNNNLRNLFIVDPTSSQFHLGKPLGDRIPPNLVKLTYRTVFNRLLADTYQQFVEMLITDCPQLEYLEFGFITRSTLPPEMNMDPNVRLLRNIRRLSRLRRLRIDVDLLADHANNWDALLTETYLLPPRLKDLELTNVCPVHLEGFIDRLLPPNDFEALRYSAPILLIEWQRWFVYKESLPVNLWEKRMNSLSGLVIQQIFSSKSSMCGAMRDCTTLFILSMLSIELKFLLSEVRFNDIISRAKSTHSSPSNM